MPSDWKKGEEGKGQEEKKKKRLHHNTVCGGEREGTRLCCGAEARERASLCLVTAPMHFTKQFGEVPNHWNVGSLHTLHREECTVCTNMRVTVPLKARPILKNTL